jgi:hypothetical protein
VCRLPGLRVRQRLLRAATNEVPPARRGQDGPVRGIMVGERASPMVGTRIPILGMPCSMISGNRVIRRVRACAFSMIIGSQDDHWHYLDQLVMLKCVQLINVPRAPSKIDKDAGVTASSAIPYQDPEQEAERLKAVHEARVKIVPRV